MDANETLSLLQSYRQKFWSWGAHAFTRIGKKALRMTVQGHHHKGHVYICVNGKDLYDVYLCSNRGNIKEVINDIYVEDLFDVMDAKIERIPEYVR